MVLGITPSVFGAEQNSDPQFTVEKLRALASDSTGISAKQGEMAKKVQALGAPAIKYLLPLLRGTNPGVRHLAAYTLRDIEGLTEKHLDALVEACRKGEGWLPPAIARIGTPKAVDFLANVLVKERQAHTQFEYAMHLLGKRAVPRLLQVYTKDSEWDDRLQETMDSIFAELGSDASSAIEPLLIIAESQAAPKKRRVHAISTLGAIGASAGSAVPVLQRLATNNDHAIRDSAKLAIVRIGSDAAVPILVKELDANPSLIGFRNIAALGTNGHDAGLALMKYLKDPDWDLRVGAIRALGFVGYEPAAEALTKQLSCVKDWRIALSATEALARLHSSQAIPELTRISHDHWYPPVKTKAALALDIIRHGGSLQSKYPAENFPFEFFDYQNAGEKMDSLDSREIEHATLKFESPSTKPMVVRVKDSGGSLTNGFRRAVAVDGGFLVPSDLGEWGGETTFVNAAGNSHSVIACNTESVHVTTNGILAVTGLSHLGMNNGALFKLQSPKKGQWTAVKWRVLPGAPIFSLMLTSGDLFVSCVGGMVTVSPDGRMKCLKRSDVISSDAPSR
jgi:HEAT repeat protein